VGKVEPEMASGGGKEGKAEEHRKESSRKKRGVEQSWLCHRKGERDRTPCGVMWTDCQRVMRAVALRKNHLTRQEERQSQRPRFRRRTWGAFRLTLLSEEYRAVVFRAIAKSTDAPRMLLLDAT
jgi:hypothetical protein